MPYENLTTPVRAITLCGRDHGPLSAGYKADDMLQKYMEHAMIDSSHILAVDVRTFEHSGQYTVIITMVHKVNRV